MVSQDCGRAPRLAPECLRTSGFGLNSSTPCWLVWPNGNQKLLIQRRPKSRIPPFYSTRGHLLFLGLDFSCIWSFFLWSHVNHRSMTVMDWFGWLTENPSGLPDFTVFPLYFFFFFLSSSNQGWREGAAVQGAYLNVNDMPCFHSEC